MRTWIAIPHKINFKIYLILQFWNWVLRPSNFILEIDKKRLFSLSDFWFVPERNYQFFQISNFWQGGNFQNYIFSFLRKVTCQTRRAARFTALPTGEKTRAKTADVGSATNDGGWFQGIWCSWWQEVGWCCSQET